MSRSLILEIPAAGIRTSKRTTITLQRHGFAAGEGSNGTVHALDFEITFIV